MIVFPLSIPYAESGTTVRRAGRLSARMLSDLLAQVPPECLDRQLFLTDDPSFGGFL